MTFHVAFRAAIIVPHPLSWRAHLAVFEGVFCAQKSSFVVLFHTRYILDAVGAVLSERACFAAIVLFKHASYAPAVIFLGAAGRTEHAAWAVLFGGMISRAKTVGRAQHARARAAFCLIVPRQTPAFSIVPPAVQGWITLAVAAAGVARGVPGRVALVVAGRRDEDAAVGNVALAVKDHRV